MTSHTLRSNGLSRGYNVFSRSAIAVLASSLIGFTASLAHADNSAAASDDVPSIAVSYADLNLATEQGTSALYRRIVAAASQVCPRNTGPDARLAALARQCVDDAVARAVNDVKSPKLAELRAAHMRRMNRG